MVCYKDREDAGKILAEKLLQYRGCEGIVYGLPRGGVVLADIIAKSLKMPLDVIVVRKIGAPFNPEFAIGALGSHGGLYLDAPTIQYLKLTKDELESLVSEQKKVAERREKLFRSGKEAFDSRGKVVIIVDDGLATGATMKVAIEEVKKGKPSKIVVAVPVGAEDSIQEISALVGEVICPLIPPYFQAVGEFYLNFRQIEDEEVVAILAKTSVLKRQDQGVEA